MHLIAGLVLNVSAYSFEIKRTKARLSFVLDKIESEQKWDLNVKLFVWGVIFLYNDAQ